MGAQLAALSAAIEPWARQALEIMTSWLAWRVYAVIAALIIVGTSWCIARSQRAEILDLRPHRGRKLKLRKSILKAQANLEETKRNARTVNLLRASRVALFGFLVPSIVFGLMLYFYSWFQPGKQALGVAGCNGISPLDPNLWSIVAYVLSQFAMGVSGIAGELAPRTFGNAPSYAPASTFAADGLLFYRYFVVGFSGLFLNLLRVAWSVSRNSSLVAREKELAEALERAG